MGTTKKDPKKFWRNIKSIIDRKNDSDENVIFRDPISGSVIDNIEVPNFLNEYFANISDRVCDQGSAKPFHPDVIGESIFFFRPPEQYEIMILAEEIDINSASGIDGINPDYTGVLHVGRFAWVFLSYVISLIFKKSESFFQDASCDKLTTEM